MALFANDACGAPIPGQMCLPWTFFDGKLFHTKLRRADTARNLMELCDGRAEIAYAVERMRGAILHGIVPHYGPHEPQAGMFASAIGAAAAAAAGRQMATAATAGGRLVVGGSVVGQWGPNPVPTGQKKKKKKKASQLLLIVPAIIME